MPSVSKAQKRFMAAAAHDPAFAKKAGISQSVAKDFNKADIGKDIAKLPDRKINPMSKKDRAGRRYSGQTFKDRNNGNAEYDTVVVKGKV